MRYAKLWEARSLHVSTTSGSLVLFCVLLLAVQIGGHERQEATLRMKTVCSWCKSHMKGPEEDDEVSHGLCPKCEWEYFPELAEGPKCRCLIVDGRWSAVMDDKTCDSCRERDGKPYWVPWTQLYCCDYVTPGVWASVVPVGSAYIPQFRHLFDGEEKLWGSAGITSRCNLNFTLDRALVFIGGISVPKSREACPECLESLNPSEVIT